MLEQLITLDQGQWCAVFRLSQACVMFCPSEPLCSTGEHSLYCAKVLKISFSFARQRLNTSTFILSHCRTSNMGVATRFASSSWEQSLRKTKQGRWQQRSYFCHSETFLRLPAIPQAVCFPPPASSGQMRDVGLYTQPCFQGPSLGGKQWLRSSILLVVMNDGKVMWCKSLWKVTWLAWEWNPSKLVALSNISFSGLRNEWPSWKRLQKAWLKSFVFNVKLSIHFIGIWLGLLGIILQNGNQA